MNLARMLAARADAGRPVRAMLIGAGKFGSMFLAQVPTTPGLVVSAIADLSPDRARTACRTVGWDKSLIERTVFTDDTAAAQGSLLLQAHVGQLPVWIEDYNEHHPLSGLRMQSPREFLRAEDRAATPLETHF